MGYYSKLTFKELMDEYFYTRLDYEKAEQEWTEENAEILSILIQNYQEIEAEIERRMFEYETCTN